LDSPIGGKFFPIQPDDHSKVFAFVAFLKKWRYGCHAAWRLLALCFSSIGKTI
jgi:hypothetical protein